MRWPAGCIKRSPVSGTPPGDRRAPGVGAKSLPMFWRWGWGAAGPGVRARRAVTRQVGEQCVRGRPPPGRSSRNHAPHLGETQRRRRVTPSSAAISASVTRRTRQAMPMRARQPSGSRSDLGSKPPGAGAGGGVTRISRRGPAAYPRERGERSRASGSSRRSVGTAERGTATTDRRSRAAQWTWSRTRSAGPMASVLSSRARTPRRSHSWERSRSCGYGPDPGAGGSRSRAESASGKPKRFVSARLRAGRGMASRNAARAAA